MLLTRPQLRPLVHIAVSRVICCVHAMSCGRQSLQPLRSPPFRLMESYENNRQAQLIRTRSGPTDQGTAERSGLGGPNSCGLVLIGKLFYCACFSQRTSVSVCVGSSHLPPFAAASVAAKASVAVLLPSFTMERLRCLLMNPRGSSSSVTRSSRLKLNWSSRFKCGASIRMMTGCDLVHRPGWPKSLPRNAIYLQ